MPPSPLLSALHQEQDVFGGDDDQQRPDTMDESFEIRVHNHKKEAVTVRVVEHLYRWTNWKLNEQSSESRKTDAQTVEFPVTIAPDGEQVVTYTVHYSW